MIVLGWDIGGSNTKVCRVENGRARQALSRPFEVKDAPDRLPALLQALAAEVAADAAIDAHAITMTAELSRNFLTKEEGVRSILEAVRAAFAPPVPVCVFTVRGELVPIDNASFDAVSVASANWMATARLVAETLPDVLLIDMGSTTTDIIPIVGGQVVNWGRTDPERLSSGELVYTGVLRTPVEGLAHEVGIANLTYGVAAEGFATSGDVYVWLGDLPPDPGPTADGRPADKPFAGERLRRALCADHDLMPDYGVTMFAQALAASQVARLVVAIERVRSRQPAIRRAVAVGLGGFVAERAARAAGLEVEPSADGRHSSTSQCAPAAAVAVLLERTLEAGRLDVRRRRHRRSFLEPGVIRRVVKVGGSLLADPGELERVMHRIHTAGSALVVPGGGPFADAVRDLDRTTALRNHHAHWMAILAMDQYAEVLLDRLGFHGTRVETLAEARAALLSYRVPVLAPSRWLRRVDPLPHSWDVTSDSIAAWVAGQAGATTLVLVKPPGATGQLTDAYFERALPAGVTCEVVTPDDRDRLDRALGIPSESEILRMLDELDD